MIDRIRKDGVHGNWKERDEECHRTGNISFNNSDTTCSLTLDDLG